MSDRWMAVLAVATAAGAYVARPLVPVPFAVVVAALALAVARPTRAPVALCGALPLLASVLGANAWRGLQVDDVTFPVPLARGWATLVTDPREVPGGVQVDIRLRGKRLRATARAPGVASSVRNRLAGEQLHVEGEIRRLEPGARGRLAGKHIAGRIELRTVDGTRPGSPLARIANALRRTLVAGTASLPANRRALYTGVILGDDRAQDFAEVEDFRAAGLTHVLAVSGQNVAFVLALAAPLLRRLGARARVITAGVALLVFGAVTRWEPSVLRAVVMALLAVWAVTNGRPATTRRVLALAVTLLVLVDPLLTRSLGFLLSVGASAGIALLSPRVERFLPPPLAVTLAAQVGVAPVLLPAFGAMPLVTIPANLLALPAAGPLMMWGLAAGLPAGVIGGITAHVLHAPTHVLLWWIATVARVAAAAPVGAVTATSALAIVAGAAAAWALLRLSTRAGSRRRRAPPLVAGAVVTAGLLAVAVAGAPLSSSRDGLASDRLWRADGHTVVVTSGRGPPGRLLSALRARRVSSIDVLVVTSRSASAGASVGAVAARIPTRLVLAPTDRRYGVGEVPTLGLRPGVRVRAGPIVVSVRSTRTVDVRAPLVARK